MSACHQPSCFENVKKLIHCLLTFLGVFQSLHCNAIHRSVPRTLTSKSALITMSNSAHGSLQYCRHRVKDKIIKIVKTHLRVFIKLVSIYFVRFFYNKEREGNGKQNSFLGMDYSYSFLRNSPIAQTCSQHIAC